MTLALEWPDLEAEEKAAKKKAQKKKAQNFIETDSEDESNRKKPRERMRSDIPRLLIISNRMYRRLTVPSESKSIVAV